MQILRYCAGSVLKYVYVLSYCQIPSRLFSRIKKDHHNVCWQADEEWQAAIGSDSWLAADMPRDCSMKIRITTTVAVGC